MKGILYGVGVGPGDPELITLKAINLIKENDVIAVAGKDAKEAVAYKIVQGTVPEIENKTLVPVYMPMVMDKEEQIRNHQKGAKMLEKYLDEGNGSDRKHRLQHCKQYKVQSGRNEHDEPQGGDSC